MKGLKVSGASEPKPTLSRPTHSLAASKLGHYPSGKSVI